MSSVLIYLCAIMQILYYMQKAAGMKIDKVLISFPINPLTALIYYCCVNVLYYQNGYRKVLQIFIHPDQYFEVQFYVRLWFEMSFLKAVILIIICQFFVVVVVVVFVFKEAGLRSPPFLMSSGKEVSDQDIRSALTNNLISRGNLFRVHGSYGAVFFINRYMYFCVVAFINDTITLSCSCLPLNFSFLQIYIKTVFHVWFLS